MENYEDVTRLSLKSEIIMYASGGVYGVAFVIGCAMIWFFQVIIYLYIYLKIIMYASGGVYGIAFIIGCAMIWFFQVIYIYKLLCMHLGVFMALPLLLVVQ